MVEAAEVLQDIQDGLDVGTVEIPGNKLGDTVVKNVDSLDADVVVSVEGTCIVDTV